MTAKFSNITLHENCKNLSILEINIKHAIISDNIISMASYNIKIYLARILYNKIPMFDLFYLASSPVDWDVNSPIC